MSWWKQSILAGVVAVAALIGWIAWMPEARPLLERAGVWPVLEQTGALAALERLGITPAESGQATGGRPGGPPGGFGGAPTVTVAEVVAKELNAVVTAIGTGQALRSVAVTPEASGRLAEILVRPGQQVAAGDVLARLDDAAERIAVDRARLVLEDARETAERRQRLQGTGAATEVQIRDAELALRTAELALAQAELDLSRRAILAPIDGYVGFVPAEVGNQVGTSTEITRIDDRSVLLVEFLVPERHVAEIAEGTPLTARPLARAAMELPGTVRAIDNRVEAASRSLTVQAQIENPGDALRAGMAFSIEMVFPGETLPAVDPLSIQWNRSGAFVWALTDGRVRPVPVRIVQRAGERVLVEAALEPGDKVVREGVQMLRPGLEVRVRPDAGADEATDGTAVSARPTSTAGSRPADAPANGRAAEGPAAAETSDS
jgi:RND family efflux transporter MFP subunit